MSKLHGEFESAVVVTANTDKVVDLNVGPRGRLEFLAVSFVDATAAGNLNVFDHPDGPTDATAARKKARNITGSLAVTSGLYRGNPAVSFVCRGGSSRNQSTQLKLVINVDKTTTCYINYVVDTDDRN